MTHAVSLLLFNRWLKLRIKVARLVFELIRYFSLEMSTSSLFPSGVIWNRIECNISILLKFKFYPVYYYGKFINSCSLYSLINEKKNMVMERRRSLARESISDFVHLRDSMSCQLFPWLYTVRQSIVACMEPMDVKIMLVWVFCCSSAKALRYFRLTSFVVNEFWIKSSSCVNTVMLTN